MIRRTKHTSTATCTLPIYMGFLMTEPNSIRCEKGQWFQLRLLPNFHQAQVVWLKDFGFVQLFKTQLKEQQRFYIVHQDEDDLLSFDVFHKLHSSHWKIE